MESAKGPSKGDPSPSEAEKIISSIIFARSYASWRVRQLRYTVLFLSLCLTVSLIGNWMQSENPPIYKSVFVRHDGSRIPNVPVHLPNRSDDEVVAWTIDKVMKLYRVDFVNYRAQYEAARLSMTPTGWRSFEQALRDSGNYKAMIENRFVVNSAPLAPGVIERKGDLGGRYGWRIRFPMLITYQPARGTPGITQEVSMSILVVRVAVNEHPDGLAIRQVLAE
jgi:intracellular multiplication protein IcmL